jgi:hypothetical protein
VYTPVHFKLGLKLALGQLKKQKAHNNNHKLRRVSWLVL